jgi:hypothetical protein
MMPPSDTTAIADNNPMIAATTINSTSVNARDRIRHRLVETRHCRMTTHIDTTDHVTDIILWKLQ